MNQGKTISNEFYKNRRTYLLQILTKALHIYDIESINDLGVTPEVQLLILYKSTLVWGFLPPEIVSILTSVNKYLVLADTYTNLPKMDKPERNYLEMYLSSCNFVSLDGILTCEEDIVFDGVMITLRYGQSSVWNWMASFKKVASYH